VQTGWFELIKEERKDILSELSTLLKAVERLFLIENLSITDQDYPNRNFYDELLIVKDVILRIVNIIEYLLPESEKNSYWFRKYVEQRFLSSSQRDNLREKLYTQDSPEKGLLLLYDAFVNIKTVIFDLLRAQSVPYMSYKNIGDIISREIRENRFFNPFSQTLNIKEEGRIDNSKIAIVVKSIENKTIKKYISLCLVGLFRLLRMLRYVITDSSEQAVINRSIAVLLLIRNELEVLRRLIDISATEIEAIREDVSNILRGLSYQTFMEIKRVYLQELRDITKRTGQKRQRGRLENSTGIIKNFIEQSIIQIVQIFNPDIKGEEVFPAFVTKKQISIKLREDIAVLHGIVSAVLEDNAKSQKPFEALKNYIHYFQSFTYRLLRYDDYEEFSNFIEEILKYLDGIEKGSPSSYIKFFDRLTHFKIFLETIIRQISQREELIGENLDEERVKAIMQNFL